MKNIIFHAGVHKTGSTFIQNVLRENQGLLSSNSIACRVGGEVWDELTSPIIYNAVGIRKNSEPMHMDCYKRALSEKIRSWVGGHETLVVSNENLFGNSSVRANKGSLYPKAKGVVSFLLETLGEEYNIKIAFLVRDYASFIESTYSQKIKEGQSFSFEEYVSNVDFDTVSWSPLINGVVEASKGFNCKVEWTRYEDFCLDQALFIKNLVFGKGQSAFDAGDLNIDASLKSNASYSLRAVEIANIINPYLSKKEVKIFRNFLKEKFPPDKFGKPRFISNELRNSLSSRYENENFNML